MKHISLYLMLCTTILALLLTGCARTDPSRLVVEPEGITRVDELLTKMTQDGTFTGSVLIAQDGVVLLSKGYGLADRAQGIPNTPQMRFRLGSMSKQFTAMAILILQSQGKLSVQDPICSYIADCPAAWRDITIHHLLTHTSGLSSEPSQRLYSILENAADDPAMPSDPAYFLGLARELPLDARPGEQYAYNNVGYVLLAHIIEQVYGQSFAAFLDQAIFSPLSMRDTGYQDSSSGVALCYTDRYVTVAGRFLSPAISDGAGGLYSTVEDLFLWDQALYTDQLLPRTELQRMFEPYVPETDLGPGFGYGYGWGVWEDRGRPVVFHTGGGPAFATFIIRYPEDELAEILLTNQGPFDGSVWVAISNALFGDNSPIQEINPDQGLVEDLSTYITAQMQAAKVPGLAIALIQEGEIVWVEGFGVTNSLTGKPVAGDTVFEAASISKAIAAYAALGLVERGVLSLDEPVHQSLCQPWLPPSAYAEQITLRHLLSHTSGLTNDVNPVNKSIVYPPGERFVYSGVGFRYLQEVLEQVTGKSFEQIAQELVFEPLEMDSSSYVVPPNMMPRLAYGHFNYGFFMPYLVPVLAVAFTMTLLVWLIIQRIRLGKFTLSGKMLWISYMIAGGITLAVEIYFVGGEVNKWATFTALWLVLFGAGMALLLSAGWKLIARLSGKWQQPKNRVALLVLWSFISVLALLVLTTALSGPVPRLPVGSPNAYASLRTTAPDLAKFLLELTSPQHLDPALMAEMTSPQVQSWEDVSWGLGIGIQHDSQGNILLHDGNNADFHALVVIDQEQRNGVVVLTNGQYGVPLVNEIVNYAMDKMSGQE